MNTWMKTLKRSFVGVLGAALLFFLLYLCLQKTCTWDILCSTPEHQRGGPGPYHVAYPGNYAFVIDDVPACKETTPFLLLVVPVAPSNRASRDAIRKTWGGEKEVLGQSVETVFMLGLPRGASEAQQQEEIRRESQQYRDLIQSDFLDSYRNLTIKTMMTQEWVVAHCLGVSYVAKVDSDMFLHVENLVRLLEPATARQDYMTGLVWWHSKVIRNPFNKFYMPSHVVPEPEYPPYPLGMFYVMSMDLPTKILGVSTQIQAVYIEDVYLGMCLKRLGIAPTDPPEDTMFQVDPRHPLSSCSLSKLVAATTQSMEQMVGYWRTSREAEAQCRNA